MATIDHSYRIWIIRVSGSGKTNSLFNLIRHQTDINKAYLRSTGSKVSLAN